MTEEIIAEQTIETPEVLPDWNDLMARFFRWPPYQKRIAVSIVHAECLGMCCMIVRIAGDPTGENSVDCGDFATRQTDIGPMCNFHAMEYGQ